MNSHYDFVISGAGPVGLSLALALTHTSFSVCVLDQNATLEAVFDVDSDQRMLALSDRSIRFYKSLGIWDKMLPFATNISTVNVSEQDTHASINLFGHDYKADQLGVVISYAAVMQALIDALNNILVLKDKDKLNHDLTQHNNLTFINNIKIRSISSTCDNGCNENNNNNDHNNNQSKHLIELNNASSLTSSYLIAAEGAFSSIRQQIGIPFIQNDYDQVAVINIIKCEHPHENIAYERFSKHGPLALLPIDTHKMAVILTVKRDQQKFWENASSADFTTAILARFDERLGNLEVIGTQQIWSLTLIIPKYIVKNNIILIGNSAHALHPIAGQGLNLGLRDVIDFIDLLDENDLKHNLQNSSIATLLSPENLSKFNRKRHKDIVKTVGATDFLIRVFGSQNLAIKALRAQGIRAVVHLPFIKHAIAKFGMGNG